MRAAIWYRLHAMSELLKREYELVVLSNDVRYGIIHHDGAMVVWYFETGIRSDFELEALGDTEKQDGYVSM